MLRLTLKRQWFNMIAAGIKKEEYRVPGKWINSRIYGKEYDVVEFKNGYGATVPTMIVEYKGRKLSTGNAAWGAQSGQVYHTLKLGKVLSLHNVIGMARRVKARI
ncbi:ASCH domain-containing protein [Luteolibacter sp. AS25]|uniref:ASCH domain-containing protein n=1 Tax=Luteolibacter sp. AS25 TaxID=3135776 RepID=UPI00398B45D9